MPISSGALGWPTSHFRKHDDYDDTKMADASAGPRGSNSDSSKTAPGGYAWTIQLSNRDEYEGWRQHFDEDAKRIFKEKRKKEKKRKKQMRKLEKQKLRDSADTVLARQRRRRCLILSLVLFIVFSGVMFGAIAGYTSYLGEDEPGPPNRLEAACEGKFRSHFLGYNIVYANGTVIFNCCYLPDVETSHKIAVLKKPPVWPDGYVVPKAACLGHHPCQYYETNSLFDSGTPPCSTASHTTSSKHITVAITSLLVIKIFTFLRIN